MDAGVLEQRGRVLEDAFFARQEKALLESLRERERMLERKQALARASGVTDDMVLDHWVALNLGPATVAALAWVPLVLVAWADGTLDAAERKAVRDAAAEAGLAGHAEAMALLDAWLASPPSHVVEEAWRDYAHAMAAKLPADARAAMERETIGRARRIAEAAGGFLGLGNRVSAAEQSVLARLSAAFH
jgi:hypothetical protein